MYDDGYLSYTVYAEDWAILAQQLVAYYRRGAQVVNDCFGKRILYIAVRGPTNDEWIGTMGYSTDGGRTFGKMVCSYCSEGRNQLVTKFSARTGFNGYSHTTYCLYGWTCRISPAR